MAGPLKTLFGALQASRFMTGVTIVFGDEEINNQKYALPMVVMVPRGGPYVTPGYVKDLDPNIELLWETGERVEFWIYAASSSLSAQGAVDHADALETLRALLLSALQDQRAQYTDVNSVAYGLDYSVTDGRWEVSTNATSRFGRSYVLSVRVPIAIAMAAPVEATVTSVLIESTSITPP